MPYLDFTSVRGRELGRRPLEGPVVIGRSPECDICVHDILLSRRHCQLEQEGSRWVVVDLVSKNGTFLGPQEIGRHVLSDGESIRIGKTVMKFCAGKMPVKVRGGAAMRRPNRPTRQRAADPWEAMQATVSGFDYYKAVAERKQGRMGANSRLAAVPVGGSSNLPTPQPRPRDPNAYSSDDVYSLLNEIVSSSWDSIYMNASRPAPTRPAPRPIARHPRYRGGAPVDMSLTLIPRTGLLAEPSPTPARTRSSVRWKRLLLGVARGVAVLGQTVMVLGISHLLH